MNKTNTSPAAAIAPATSTDREIKVVTVPEGPRDLADAILEANREQDGKSIHQRRAARKQASARALKPVSEIPLFSTGERNLHHELGHFPSEAEAKKAATSNEGVVIDRNGYKSGDKRMFPLEEVLKAIRQEGAQRVTRVTVARAKGWPVATCSKSGTQDTGVRTVQTRKGPRDIPNFFVPETEEGGCPTGSLEDLLKVAVRYTEVPANAGKPGSSWFSVGYALKKGAQAERKAAFEEEREKGNVITCSRSGREDMITRTIEPKGGKAFEGDNFVVLYDFGALCEIAGVSNPDELSCEDLRKQAIHVRELNPEDGELKPGQEGSPYSWLTRAEKALQSWQTKAKDSRRRNGGAFGKQTASTVEADEESLVQAYLDGNFRAELETVRQWVKDGELTQEMVNSAPPTLLGTLMADGIVDEDMNLIGAPEAN